MWKRQRSELHAIEAIIAMLRCCVVAGLEAEDEDGR